ncbi:MAG: AI-2E family transporter [Tangfeifania sp.]
MKNFPLVRIAAVLFILSVLMLVLILAKNILVPLAISLLLAYLIYPIVWRLERWGFHRIPAILVVIITVLIIAGAIGLYLSVQVGNINFDIIALKERFIQGDSTIEARIGEFFGMNIEQVNNYIQSAIQNIISAIASSTGNVFSATTTTVFQIFILPVFTFFILFYRTKTAFFILRLAGKENRKKTINILHEITTVTSRYLAGLIGVVSILAVLNSLGLTIIGVPHALVLGIGAALLNLIPYFGTLLGALVPLIYVLISLPDPWSMAFKVIIMFIIVQFLENNIITPNVVGTNVRINALTIIIGLLIGNLIWGIAGMLIIIPYIAILKIIMGNIESLEPYAYFLSSKGLERYQVHFLQYFINVKEKLKMLWSGKK